MPPTCVLPRAPLQATAPRLALPTPAVTQANPVVPPTVTVEGRPVKRLTQAE